MLLDAFLLDELLGEAVACAEEDLRGPLVLLVLEKGKGEHIYRRSYCLY
jgi:hypothetical protein